MQNAQLKKILIITCCLLVGVGVLFIRWYIKSNIDRHSVYYVINQINRKLDINRKVVLLGYLVIDFIFIMELMRLMMRNLF